MLNEPKTEEKMPSYKKTNDIVMKDPTGMVQIFLRLPIFSISNSHLYVVVDSKPSIQIDSKIVA